jgi:hypothetical protein
MVIGDASLEDMTSIIIAIHRHYYRFIIDFFQFATLNCGRWQWQAKKVMETQFLFNNFTNEKGGHCVVIVCIVKAKFFELLFCFRVLLFVIRFCWRASAKEKWKG